MQRSKALFPGTLHPAGCRLRTPEPPTRQFCTPLSEYEALANADVAVINSRAEEGVLPLKHYFCRITIDLIDHQLLSPRETQ